VVVTLLASVVNFVVDYLFIDILSAPTVDSLKANRPNNNNNHTPTPNTNVEQTATSAESSSPSKRPHSLEIAKRASFKDSLLSNAQTRIVSTSLADAHSNAMETFKDAMGEAQSEVERVCQKITSQRVTRLTRIKSNSNFGTSGVGRALPMTLHPSHKPFQHDGADAEDLFSTLKEEIVEERALIRRQYEKAAFEALWGSVVSSSLT
jgi:vacuolar-type H+-ATPase subunit H